MHRLWQHARRRPPRRSGASASPSCARTWGRDDGREVRKSNPLEQAKQYAFGVCRLLESDPALVGEPGTSFQGKLAFPWGYGVVLANISRKAFAGTDLGNVIPPGRVICQDVSGNTRAGDCRMLL